MAKTYYKLEEALGQLGCTNDELKGLVRAGRLREFLDAGKPNYLVEEVDQLASELAGGTAMPADSGELALEDSGEIPLAPLDEPAPSGAGDADMVPGLSGSGDAISLDGSGSGSGAFNLETGSGELRLEDSGGGTGGLPLGDSGGGTGGINLADSGVEPASVGLEDSGSGGGGTGADIVSLDEVDKDAVEGMKKDDTVITNIGISVFDDDDLEIAADPMAKTLMTGGDEHLGLDGSGGGSGLLDLTRESDDTSLGAELLEGIDMGDTADTEAQPVAAQPAEPAEEVETEPLPEPEMGPAVVGVPMPMVGMVEAVSPAFTGLLIAGTLVLALAGALNVATSLGAWPAYLDAMARQFWLLLGAGIGLGGLLTLGGWLMGRQAGAPRRPKAPKPPKDKKTKKGKKGKQPEADVTADVLEMPE